MSQAWGMGTTETPHGLTQASNVLSRYLIRHARAMAVLPVRSEDHAVHASCHVHRDAANSDGSRSMVPHRDDLLSRVHRLGQRQILLLTCRRKGTCSIALDAACLTFPSSRHLLSHGPKRSGTSRLLRCQKAHHMHGLLKCVRSCFAVLSSQPESQPGGHHQRLS